MDRRACRHIMETVGTVGISVTDVYDQAAGIAQEFDKLITAYGHDAVTDLMPKVIKALEQLESLASRYEKETDEINQLRFMVEKLQNEKAEKAQERARFEHELEQIEDNWQKEVKELLAANGKLQEENRRLRANIDHHKETVVAEITEAHKKTEEQEIKVLVKLKSTVDKQREELRTLHREINQKTVDCDALQDQLERIAKVNSELRRKHTTQKKQARTLLEEKADLEVALAQKDAQVESIREQIKNQESYESAKAQAEKPKEDEETEQMSEEQKLDMHQRLTLEGKIIIDMNDPNRPRFTLQELRQVLMERNELKTKLIEVEEELAHYRPKEEEVEMKDMLEDKSASDYRGDEVMVYGPINKEPDYKLNPDGSSGIRKLFRFFFETSPKRERSKSRLTKK